MFELKAPRGRFYKIYINYKERVFEGFSFVQIISKRYISCYNGLKNNHERGIVMIRFNCDYSEGAHEKILARLIETNMEQTPGYGEDEYCYEAADMIRKEIGNPDAAVHFLVGGTQTNLIVIDAALRPHQGVIAADSGHIATHESGAIEGTGHKVMTIPSKDGTIWADEIKALWASQHYSQTAEHEVQPGMVYISFPTENGTLYTKKQLEDIYKVCRECGLLLFVDGARLGYGLMSPACDINMADLAANCDAFYIGGTKLGFLFGEALVITDKGLNRDFRYFIKHHGAMLAKGRLLGVQFGAAFKDGLYYDMAKNAIDLAMEVKKGVKEAGFEMLFDSYTNQQYVIMPDETVAELEKNYAFALWCKPTENTSCIRICTSWATKAEDVKALLEDIRKLSK